jgi:hypothetical protein
MHFPRRTILAFIGILLLATLACGLPFDNPLEERPPAVETAEEAARLAGNAAQTAAAQAGARVGAAVAVATTEGSQFIGTAKAVAAPHADYLKEKLASIEPDAEGNYRVTLTEEEVNTVLRLRQLLTGDILGAGVQSQEVKFRDGSITLSGSIIEPLPGELLVIMRPSIEDGRLQLETVEASLAGKEAPDEVLEAPEKALAAAEEALDGTLGEALEYVPIGVRLLEITAVDGELTITGSNIDGDE